MQSAWYLLIASTPILLPGNLMVNSFSGRASIGKPWRRIPFFVALVNRSPSKSDEIGTVQPTISLFWMNWLLTSSKLSFADRSAEKQTCGAPRNSVYNAAYWHTAKIDEKHANSTKLLHSAASMARHEFLAYSLPAPCPDLRKAAETVWQAAWKQAKRSSQNIPRR